MAIVKHIAVKNSNYDAASDYLTMQYDEFTNRPVLDQNGRQLHRDFYLLDGINCDPWSFDQECRAVNAKYGKNRSPAEIKAHHYIISFDPRDRDENRLTPEHAQKLGLDFARRNFPGHQIIVCTHRDGHNSAGNIHVHIVLNSVRKLDVPLQDFMERPGDAKAGNKHHVTKKYLEYLKQSVMDMCQEENLYQVDLLSPARIKMTDREYWAKRLGQKKLDQINAEKKEKGIEPSQTVYRTEKELLRAQISVVMQDSHSFDEFREKLFREYGISVHESRGRLSYLTPDRTKPIRARMLGTDYEKDFLESFFKNNPLSFQQHLPLKPERETSKNESSVSASQKLKWEHSSVPRRVVDVDSNEKARANRFYAQKVKISNLQQMSLAQLFMDENGFVSPEQLKQLADATKTDVDDKLSVLKETESELRRINLLIRNTGQYLANKDVYQQYLKSQNKKAFRQENESSILLYEAARKELRELSGGKTIPSLKQLKKDKQELIRRKNVQYENYSFSRSRYRELQIISLNAEALFNKDLEHITHQNQERN